jgi:type II secretory pathway pseudopilin PulG
VASLISGIFFFFLPAAIAAIVLGHVALSQIKKSAGRLSGRGMAIAGLVLGYGGVAFIPIILIIAAIAIPNVLRAHTAANEAMAVASIRLISNAETVYRSGHGEQGYTCNLTALGGRTSHCSPSPEYACLIDERLASGRKYGYIFELSECQSSEPGKPVDKYRIVATPFMAAGSSRTFCADESGEIKSTLEHSSRACLESGLPMQ